MSSPTISKCSTPAGLDRWHRRERSLQRSCSGEDSKRSIRLSRLAIWWKLDISGTRRKFGRFAYSTRSLSWSIQGRRQWCDCPVRHLQSRWHPVRFKSSCCHAVRLWPYKRHRAMVWNWARYKMINNWEYGILLTSDFHNRIHFPRCRWQASWMANKWLPGPTRTICMLKTTMWKD